jgi:23S rRNA G2069 N7-methylase RlmK/C1962 C5-methylase RlmI
MGSPMVIHFYDKDSEMVKTFTRSFVPWKLLKEAVKVSKNLDQENMTEQDVDALTGLVVSVFGDQFTVEELNNQADTTEMLAVLNQIVTTAKGLSINPTPAGKK